MTRSNSIPPATEIMRLIGDLHDTVSRLEISNQELRQLLGLRQSTSPYGNEYLSAKQYAHDSGLTESGVRSRIQKKTIVSIKRGGRRLIPRTELR